MGSSEYFSNCSGQTLLIYCIHSNFKRRNFWINRSHLDKLIPFAFDRLIQVFWKSAIVFVLHKDVSVWVIHVWSRFLILITKLKSERDSTTHSWLIRFDRQEFILSLLFLVDNFRKPWSIIHRILWQLGSTLILPP